MVLTSSLPIYVLNTVTTSSLPRKQLVEVLLDSFVGDSRTVMISYIYPNAGPLNLHSDMHIGLRDFQRETKGFVTLLPMPSVSLIIIIMKL
uniref:Uncharacterized protein n=1 Tax=Picea sitchensis TaxID=3332 RepID=B8LNJ4_PICSI|nr:unknown [Picea sitchensis]